LKTEKSRKEKFWKRKT